MGGGSRPRVGRAVGRASNTCPWNWTRRGGHTVLCLQPRGAGPPPTLPPAELCLQHSSLGMGDPSFPCLQVMVFMQGGCRPDVTTSCQSRTRGQGVTQGLGGHSVKAGRGGDEASCRD